MAGLCKYHYIYNFKARNLKKTIYSTKYSWIGCHCSISRCGFSIACSQCLYSLSTFTQYPRCTVPKGTSRTLPRCFTLNMTVICGSLSECMSNTNTSLKFGVSVLCAVFVVRLLSFLPQKVTSSLTNGSEREETSISKLPLISPPGYKSMPQNTMAPRLKLLQGWLFLFLGILSQNQTWSVPRTVIHFSAL